MSLLWEQSCNGTHYSVRSSGGSIRLYTNRVFHSQWNPRQPFAGGIWDCLSLPVLHRSATGMRRVLVLGVGGGAVIRQLQQIYQYEAITAVEIDALHLEVARDWFGIQSEGASLVHDDAINWLYQYDGPAFDLIIDDLFGHSEGNPVRACALEIDWLSLLRDHLSQEGVLVANCINSRELLDALPAIGASGFSWGYRWHLPTYENVVGVFSPKTLHARQWSRKLENSELSRQSQRQARAITKRPLRGLGLYRD